MNGIGAPEPATTFAPASKRADPGVELGQHSEQVAALRLAVTGAVGTTEAATEAATGAAADTEAATDRRERRAVGELDLASVLEVLDLLLQLLAVLVLLDDLLAVLGVLALLEHLLGVLQRVLAVLQVLGHRLATADRDVGRHRRRRRRDGGDRDAGRLADERLGRRRGGVGEGGVAGRTGIGITAVAAVLVELELAQVVGLDEADLVVVLVGVAALVLVDVPDQQSVAGQVGVEPGPLAVLDQEVLGAAGAVLPQSVDVPRRLHVGERQRRGRGHVGHRRPTLVDLAPRRGVSRDVTAAVPRAAAHQTPVADTFGGAVGVVQVGPAEQQVTELVDRDADLGVLRDRQVAEHLRPVRRHRRAEHPLVRPDVARVAGGLAAGAGVDDDEGVDEAVGVVVVGGEVDVRVGGVECMLGHVASVGGARRATDPEVAVGVPGEGLRHPVGADDLAGEIDQAVRRSRGSTPARCRGGAPRWRRTGRWK